MAPHRWQAMDDLFHAALAHRPENRPAFLDAACAGDEALRRDIESLVGHDRESGSFLEHPALEAAAQQLAGDVRRLASDPQIPGYTILRTLGEGGMGIVYLAEQVTPIRRQVALKLIKHGMDTRQFIVRFEAERQALARMHHPHIAAVFDAGTTGDGRPFFVMEYVEGVPITDYCDRHQLSTRARLELFTDVCAGVQHAHQKGVIHRDLKPSNVLVSDGDARPLPKIIDFGVAKAVEHSLAGRTAFTEQGTIVGTPEYMSPEQAALSQDIDTATDVYSLGVLLYELLVGVLPFDPTMLRAAGYDEMRRVIRESDPPKPSKRLTGAGPTADAAASARHTDAGRLTRELKGDLDWITLKAIEKDRRQRYATVSALAADVTHYLADEPIAARPPSVLYRTRKFARRYRGLVVGAAAVLIVLVAGLTASVFQYVRAEGQRQEADRQRARADVQRTAAEASSRDAAAQRNAAVLATDEANRQRIVATSEATLAVDAKQEADYRAYVATIAAADAELRLNFATSARNRLLAIPAPERAWEWQHLFLKTDTSLVTLDGSPACDSYRPNKIDTTLALRNDDARIYLRRCAALDAWSGPSHTHSHTTFAANGPAWILAIGTAGQVVVASGTGDQTRDRAPWEMRVVDAASNRTLAVLGPFAAAPLCADISVDGTRLAVGLAPVLSARAEPLDDVFETWDLRTSQRLTRMAPPKPPLFDTRYVYPQTCLIAFSPDARYVASSGATVHVWHAGTGAEVAADATQAGDVRQPIAFNADGSRLAIGRPTGLVDILNLDSTRPMNSLGGGGFIRGLSNPQFSTDLERRLMILGRKKDEVLSVAFSPDGLRVITGADIGVGVWDVALGRLTNVLAGHDAAVISVAVAYDGRIVSADVNGKVRLWSAGASGAVTVLPGFGDHGGDIALSRDGAVAGIGQFDGGVSAWQLSDFRREVLRVGTGRIGDPPPARPMVVTPDGRQLIAGTDKDALGTVTWWTLPSGGSTAVPMNQDPEEGCENPGPRPIGVTVLALSADGRTLAFNQGPCVVVRDLSTMKTLARLHENPSDVRFRPDGSLIVAVRTVPPASGGPAPSKVLIWDWRTARKPSRVQALPPVAAVWRLAASADGRRIALFAGNPAIVSIWDGNLERELGRLPVPPDTLRVAFSPDGHRIASTASDTTIRIWDADRYQLLLILPDEDPHIGGIAFTPDGRLIAGRSGGGLTIWETRKK